MYRSILIGCCVLLVSCSTVSDFYQETAQPIRPQTGYSRGIFPNRIQINSASLLCSMLATRSDWRVQKNNFKSLYPQFSIKLLGFNNLDEKNSFTWQERLMFSDALELVIFIVNHPSFENKMSREELFDNKRKHTVSVKQVVQDIRESHLNIFIAKDSLPSGVLAQATLGGLAHTIWFRNDKNYQEHNLIFLTMILAHELIHNLGYTHDSNVPYVIQDVVLEIIQDATAQEIALFQQNTPFYEQDFLTRVRGSESSQISHQRQIVIQDSYADMFQE